MELVGLLIVGVPFLIYLYAFASRRGSPGYTLGAALLFLLALGATVATFFPLVWVLTQMKRPVEGPGLWEGPAPFFVLGGFVCFGIPAVILWILYFSLKNAPDAPPASEVRPESSSEEPSWVEDRNAARPGSPAARRMGRRGPLPTRTGAGRFPAGRDEAYWRRLRSWAVLGLIGVVASLIALRVLSGLDRRPAHDETITCIFLSADEEQLFSVDTGGLVKRWSLPRRSYRGSLRNPALAGARRIEAASGGELLVWRPGGMAVFSSLDQESPTATLDGANDAALAPESLLVVGEASGITWRSLSAPTRPVARLDWDAGALLVAVSRTGEVSFMDSSATLVTASGDPMFVTRTVRLKAPCERLLYSPSGAFLVLQSERQRYLVLAASSSRPEEGPGPAEPGHSGFIGPDTVTWGRVSVNRHDLAKRDNRPYWNQGISTTMMVGSPRYERSVFAADREIYVVGRPDGWSERDRRRRRDPRAIDGVRLRHLRF